MKVKVLAAMALMGCMAFNAYAVDQDITVTASIDPMMTLMMEDGSNLPSAIEMKYLADMNKLAPKIINTRVHTNDVEKDLNIKLYNAAQLTHTLTPANTIPLTVKFDGKALTTTNTTFTATSLFSTAKGAGASRSIPLEISSGNVTPAAGFYTGLVRLAVVQAP
ncbi:CS1 type fimbrial major subunit [Pantoea sp. GCM10028869]|uniref:CS1 type fimbrial major subunit n=1 Tax=Pantoea sp. GCM10028869 TaxID=3273417 RepID=UPI003614CE71